MRQHDLLVLIGCTIIGSQLCLYRAGELGVPVGHMTFKGLLNHIEDIEALATEYPDTKVFIDHMGFCKAAEPDGKDWQALYGLARFPQVYVKVRSFYQLSLVRTLFLTSMKHFSSVVYCWRFTKSYRLLVTTTVPILRDIQKGIPSVYHHKVLSAFWTSMFHTMLLRVMEQARMMWCLVGIYR